MDRDDGRRIAKPLYGDKPYRGFESPSLRHFNDLAIVAVLVIRAEPLHLCPILCPGAALRPLLFFRR